MAFFSGDVGVVLTFNVTENGGPVDLSAAQSIQFLLPVAGGVLSLDCTIPTSPTGSPTYTTTGGEGIPKGTNQGQLRIVFDANHVFLTDTFQVFVK